MTERTLGVSAILMPSLPKNYRTLVAIETGIPRLPSILLALSDLDTVPRLPKVPVYLIPGYCSPLVYYTLKS